MRTDQLSRMSRRQFLAAVAALSATAALGSRAVGALAAPSGSVWLGALCVLLLARAVALPLTARRRRVPPLATGLTECVSSLCAFAAVTVSVLV